MKNISFQILGFVFAFAPAALGLQNVTTVPLSDKDCSEWPNYDPTSGVAGYFNARINSSGNALDGFGDVTVAYAGLDPSIWGYLAITAKDINLAHNSIYCFNSSLHTSTDLKPPGRPAPPNDYTFQPLALSPETLRIEVRAGGIPLKPYAHEVDGVRLPGVFFGAQGSTTWAFAKLGTSAIVADVWVMRLLLAPPKDETFDATGGALKDGEFEGFLLLS